MLPEEDELIHIHQSADTSPSLAVQYPTGLGLAGPLAPLAPNLESTSQSKDRGPDLQGSNDTLREFKPE